MAESVSGWAAVLDALWCLGRQGWGATRGKVQEDLRWKLYIIVTQ